MSQDTPELRRSTLQRKDREELNTIAASLGLKAPSRARKAEIVDLILDAVGGEPNSEAAGGDDGADAADGAAKKPSKSKAKAKKPAADTNDDNGGEADSGGDDDDSDSSGRGDDDQDSGRQRNKSRRGSKGKGDRNDKDRNDKDRNDRNDGDDGDDDEPEEGNRNRSRNRDDQNESGNRRRRRRGRDRGRDDLDPWDGEPVAVEGYLDLRDEGFGFLRTKGWKPSKQDAYIPVKLIRQLGLRRGDHLVGTSRPPSRNEKNPAILTIDKVNHDDPAKAADRPRFDDLTPLFPDERLTLEDPKDDPYNMTTRIIDLLSPIGKGQRGLIVAPPKAGKTTVMKEIARAIESNHPEVHLIVLLVDERPEEVTDMKRWLKGGEVIASTFDRPPEEHTQVAEIAIERAKRMVEQGVDVVVILDGITRLARAYNLAAPGNGRVMSGGLDTGALYPPKRFFGAARNIEEGGSLTILASALVETGSKMDEVIFEEFKGTGNMELRLDRNAAERRVYPAIDIEGSSTRHEELLFERKQLEQVWKLRRVLAGMAEGGPSSGLELVIERLATFKTNADFLAEVGKGSTIS